MECSTQESSFVAAWVQEWILNQRVGGYLVRNGDMNPVTLYWHIYSFPFFVAVSLDYAIHAYFCRSDSLCSLWFCHCLGSHFTIFPIICLYCSILTADVLYDLGTALEVVSPLCPQLFLEVAGLGNFAKVAFLTEFLLFDIFACKVVF